MQRARAAATATSPTRRRSPRSADGRRTLVEEINQRLAKLNEWGIELKGLDEGLIDFPSERDGRTVYLCWKLGEDRIEWWHELDTGFAGRQPL